MKLIFETLTNHDGTPIDPPHRKVMTLAKPVTIAWEVVDSHTTSDWVDPEQLHVLVRDSRRRILASCMVQYGSQWTVGDYLYDQMRIEP